MSFQLFTQVCLSEQQKSGRGVLQAVVKRKRKTESSVFSYDFEIEQARGVSQCLLRRLTNLNKIPVYSDDRHCLSKPEGVRRFKSSRIGVHYREDMKKLGLAEFSVLCRKVEIVNVYSVKHQMGWRPIHPHILLLGLDQRRSPPSEVTCISQCCLLRFTCNKKHICQMSCYRE